MVAQVNRRAVADEWRERVCRSRDRGIRPSPTSSDRRASRHRRRRRTKPGLQVRGCKRADRRCVLHSARSLSFGDPRAFIGFALAMQLAPLTSTPTSTAERGWMELLCDDAEMVRDDGAAVEEWVSITSSVLAMNLCAMEAYALRIREFSSKIATYRLAADGLAAGGALGWTGADGDAERKSTEIPNGLHCPSNGANKSSK